MRSNLITQANDLRRYLHAFSIAELFNNFQSRGCLIIFSCVAFFSCRLFKSIVAKCRGRKLPEIDT